MWLLILKEGVEAPATQYYVYALIIGLFDRDLSPELGIPISSFSPSAHEIHFQNEFFEVNLPFISPNILISRVPSVSTNACNW